MVRGRLLILITLMVGLIAGIIVLCSPYAPLVEPVREIEEIWAIEDIRQESETPLVVRLENNSIPLAYEKNENTFYCSLGLDHGSEWPEIKLTIPDAKGVSVCFVDDYAYDGCSDAIAEGYTYELIAYTDAQYSYFNMVFTGLPIVQLNAKEEIGVEEIESDISISSLNEKAQGRALTHMRGAATMRYSGKKSYKVDFVRDANASGAYLDVPLLGMEDDLLLLSCSMDDLLLRDKLSWVMYDSLADETKPFGSRKCEYVELFISGEYAGVYLMMPPVEYAEELLKESAFAATTDSVYRTFHLSSGGDRPYIVNEKKPESGYELFYVPSGRTDFRSLEKYLEIEQMQEDEAFVDAALKHIDLQSILQHYLFVQAGSLSDNVYNNMYIWAHQTEDGVVYRFAPWDMDLSWGCNKDPQTGQAYQWTYGFAVAERLIKLDAGGVVHDHLASQWRRMRNGAFNAETVRELLDGFERELNNSGAFARNTVRWDKKEFSADGSEIVEFVYGWFSKLDDMFGIYGEPVVDN